MDAQGSNDTNGAPLLADPNASREEKRKAIAKFMSSKPNRHEPGKCLERDGSVKPKDFFRRQKFYERVGILVRNLLLGTTGPTASLAIQPENEQLLRKWFRDVDGLQSSDGSQCTENEKCVEVLFQFGIEVVPAREKELSCGCPWRFDPKKPVGVFLPPTKTSPISGEDYADRCTCRLNCPALASERIKSASMAKTRRKDGGAASRSSAKRKKSNGGIPTVSLHEGDLLDLQPVKRLTFFNWPLDKLQGALFASGPVGETCSLLTQELKNLSKVKAAPGTNQTEVYAKYWAEHCPLNQLCLQCSRIRDHRDNLKSFLNEIQLNWHGAAPVESDSEEKRSEKELVRERILSMAAELGECFELFLAIDKKEVTIKKRKHYFSTRDKEFQLKYKILYKAPINREIIDMIHQMNDKSPMGDNILKLIEPEHVGVSSWENISHRLTSFSC
jgi:hypothetical protein